MLHCTVSSLVPHRYEYCRGSCGELPQKSPKLCFVVCCDSENKRWDVRINNYVVPTHFRSSSYTVYTHSHTDTVRVRHSPRTTMHITSRSACSAFHTSRSHDSSALYDPCQLYLTGMRKGLTPQPACAIFTHFQASCTLQHHNTHRPSRDTTLQLRRVTAQIGRRGYAEGN